jgi:hypothetical protein
VFWQFNGTNLPGKTNNTLTLTNLQLNQSGEYRAVVTNIYGKATSEVAVVEIYQPVLLEWGLDTTNLVWSTGGDVPWFGLASTDLAHDGIDVARSGLAPDEYEDLSLESKISTRVDGPGTIVFWWRLSGLETDLLQFYIHGINQGILPQEDGEWEQHFITVPANTNRLLEWIYTRADFIDTDDSDGGYLDQVVYIPATNAPPRFLSAYMETNGFNATIFLDPFRPYRIQRSTNLTVWTDVTNFTSSQSLFQFVDEAATNSVNGRRYYRVKNP